MHFATGLAESVFNEILRRAPSFLIAQIFALHRKISAENENDRATPLKPCNGLNRPQGIR